MKQFTLIVMLFVMLVGLVPLQASATFSLVPCGRADQIGTVDEECQLGHFFVLIIRVINYMISLAGVVAIFYVLNAGFGLIFALGNSEKIQSNKDAIQNAVVGFAIVVLAFVFVNLLVNGLFGTSSSSRRWWEPGCLYDINNSANGCPKLQFYPSSQRAAVRTTAVALGTCTGAVCADRATSQALCGPVPVECYKGAVNNFSDEITRGLAGNTQICSGVDATKILKAIMARESSGIATRVSSSDPPSLGLFQLKVDTAKNFNNGCTTDTIDRAWLLDGDNAVAQACIAVAYLRSLAGVCGCDVKQLAAGYNGGADACMTSANCGPSAGSGQCSVCANQSGPTKKWECPWDDNAHQMCNASRSGNFSQTRSYAPRVEYCYSQF